MMTTQSRKIFVNLAVKDLSRSQDFFHSLGFQFDPKFTDANATCMIISDQAFVMLLAELFFQTFTRRRICDTGSQTEGLFALECGSRAEVDELANKKARAAGAKDAMAPQDHAFMYGRSFYDLDGHHWEVLWMDPKGMPAK